MWPPCPQNHVLPRNVVTAHADPHPTPPHHLSPITAAAAAAAAVFMAKNAVLSSFATGRQTSLVVDAGHERTVGEWGLGGGGGGTGLGRAGFEGL